MKTYLFFDTETTGKADFNAPPTAKHQPRIVQLGAILQDDSGREIASVNQIIKPTGFEIPVEASNIHGITTEHAKKFGLPMIQVMVPFLSLMQKADCFVCHNSDFDMLMARVELSKLFAEIPLVEVFCTMKAMTDICRLPGKYDTFKWPNLQEAHKHCFGKEFEGAHDAMADVRACRDVFFWMQAQKPV